MAKTKLTGERVGPGQTVKLSNDAIWPNSDQEHFIWMLRNGSQVDIVNNRYILAEILGAYSKLFDLSATDRTEVCNAIKGAK